MNCVFTRPFFVNKQFISIVTLSAYGGVKQKQRDKAGLRCKPATPLSKWYSIVNLKKLTCTFESQ